MLQNTQLTYFRNAEPASEAAAADGAAGAKEERGTFVLDEKASLRYGQSGEHFTLKLNLPSSHKVLYLRTDNKEEAEAWVEAIQPLTESVDLSQDEAAERAQQQSYKETGERAVRAFEQRLTSSTIRCHVSRPQRRSH